MYIIGLLKKRIKQIKIAFGGYLIKWKIDYWGIGKVGELKQKEGELHPQIIVSLTSYGRRVEKVVFYTLISLLKQTYMPNRIILWLDNDNWNDSNIPSRLSKLKRYGIEFKFCKDLRSYKKLIPCLQHYPNDIIITVDDDVYYSTKLIKGLYDHYLKDNKSVFCYKAVYPQFDDKGKILPYNNWSKEQEKENIIFPVGVGGILYPPHSLHKDVLKENLFMSLCPLADDIWFWFMAIKGMSHHKIILSEKMHHYSFDSIYQYFHKGSALTHSNSQNNKNDEQISNLFKYYNIESKKDLFYHDK